MARGGRCSACDEKLGGAARFCAACGAPAGSIGLDVTSAVDDAELVVPGEPLVRERSRWLMPVGLLVVGALVAVLALSRLDGDSGAAEPPPTTSTPTTVPTTTTTSTTTTSTTPAATTTVPIGFVDVSLVPDDLAGTTLILLGMGSQISALDLGTGELTPIESEASFTGDAQLQATPLGIVRRRWTSNSEEVTIIDWDLTERTGFESSELGPVLTGADGELWAMTYGELPSLSLLSREGTLRPVRPVQGWATLAGTIGPDALISSSWSGSTHRVSADGSTELVVSEVSLGGGRDWILTAGCDGTLDCSLFMV